MINIKQTGVIVLSFLTIACQKNKSSESENKGDTLATVVDKGPQPISEPLVTHIYTADPSAHVFNGKIYVYPSHDVKTDIQDNDNGDQYAMVDYHVLSLPEIGGPVTDHGVVLSLPQIPWASKQLWAPDAAF